MGTTIDQLSPEQQKAVSLHQLDSNNNGTIDQADVPRIDAVLAATLPGDAKQIEDAKKVIRSVRSVALTGAVQAPRGGGVAVTEALAKSPAAPALVKLSSADIE